LIWRKPLNIGLQHPGGDVLARKNGRLYLFSVKARDRFGQNGKHNPGYNVYPEKVIKAERAYKAKPAWLVIRADRRDNTLCSYWGLIEQIPPGEGTRNRVYVSMSERAIADYKCLASNVNDPTIAQRRTDLGSKPRRGLRKKSLNPGYHASAAKSSDSTYLDRVLEKEGERRLREAPVAAAPVPGERAADEERLRAIRMRQAQEEERRKKRMRSQKKG
jgi:hypothetical protein